MCYFKLQGAEYVTTEETKKPDHISETKPQHHLSEFSIPERQEFSTQGKDIVLYTFTFLKNEQLMLPTCKEHAQGAPPML
jgi:hypothetical protein